MSRIRKAPAGILGFPVAPFNTQGKLEEEALFQNIEFLLNEGLEAIFIACGSGEFQSLSQKEYEQMVEVAVSAAGGKVPVYTGWAATSAQRLIGRSCRRKRRRRLLDSASVFGAWRTGGAVPVCENDY